MRPLPWRRLLPLQLLDRLNDAPPRRRAGHAARVVLAARPDMTASDAMAGGAVATGIAPTNA